MTGRSPVAESAEVADEQAVIALVTGYLDACERRDLEAAATALAPDARLTFPGGRVFTDLPAMVADASQRYRVVRKHAARTFASAEEEGAWTVVQSGALSGEGLDGRPFSGIRYLDVFRVRDGLIVEQQVYNDFAEAGIVEPTARPR